MSKPDPERLKQRIARRRAGHQSTAHLEYRLVDAVARQLRKESGYRPRRRRVMGG